MLPTLPARLRRALTNARTNGRLSARIRAIFSGAAIEFRVAVISALAVTALFALYPPGGYAQIKTVWDGAYTEQQAARGANSFMSYCGRCHSTTNDPKDGRSLAGEAFWKSFRESTVDGLLDYISRSMPNGAGGSLSPAVYSDIVAFILSRNSLPAGSLELSKDSAAGVRIIARDGPGELPDGTLIRVVGCLAPAEGGGWVLNTATNPERPTSVAAAEEDKTRALGTRSYRLMFVISSLQRFVGHRLSVRGLLMGDGGRDGINVSMTQSVAESCN